MTINTTFHFPSPISFYAWYGDAAIADKLFSEWGWVITRSEAANSNALADFIASTPEPSATQEQEQAILCQWEGWHFLATYFSFGALREIYNNYSVPIIEFTVPSGSDLSHLNNVMDFYLDLMIGQQFYFVYVREGTLWLDRMQGELSRKDAGKLVFQNSNVICVEWLLNVSEFPGYGFKDYVAFSSNLYLNLQRLGLPTLHWQDRDQQMMTKVLDISRQNYHT